MTVQADPRSDARPARQEAAPSPAALATVSQPPSVAELDALSAAFVDAYDRGRVDAFAALFDAAAETNFYRGRAAIRGEYEELFPPVRMATDAVQADQLAERWRACACER